MSAVIKGIPRENMIGADRLMPGDWFFADGELHCQAEDGEFNSSSVRVSEDGVHRSGFSGRETTIELVDVTITVTRRGGGS